MNLSIVSSSAPILLRSLRITEYENVKAWQRRRASVTLRPVRCFTTTSSPSSASSPPQEVDTATAPPPLQRPQKSSTDLADFKPPPPALPDKPKDLATDLPFQYWYSYADLPPGIPKRIAKNPLLEDGESRDFVDRKGTNGNGNGNGGLWEAVLAVESESNLDTPKVRQRRGGSNGGDSLREAENGWKRRRAADVALQEVDENTPLTQEEKNTMLLSCHGTRRQINVGWDGWNPNYVALVHTYWKRWSVCKIKCKGVVTLDLDSFCKLLETETGGTVIHRVGGSLYIFRGRNYNYWRDPHRLLVRYPRVITRFPKRLPVPVNLTKEEIKALRDKGRDLPALCKPGQHGVYLTLLDDVRKSFETQDLVRVNCQRFHSKNLKLLGSQLQNSLRESDGNPNNQYQQPPPYPYQQPPQGQHSREYAPYPQMNRDQSQVDQRWGTPVMGAPANPSAHPANQQAATGGIGGSGRHGSGSFPEQVQASQSQTGPSVSGRAPQDPYVQSSDVNSGPKGGSMDKIRTQVAEYSKQAEQVKNRVWGHCEFNTPQLNSCAELTQVFTPLRY